MAATRSTCWPVRSRRGIGRDRIGSRRTRLRRRLFGRVGGQDPGQDRAALGSRVPPVRWDSAGLGPGKMLVAGSQMRRATTQTVCVPGALTIGARHAREAWSGRENFVVGGNRDTLTNPDHGHSMQSGPAGCGLNVARHLGRCARAAVEDGCESQVYSWGHEWLRTRTRRSTWPSAVTPRCETPFR